MKKLLLISAATLIVSNSTFAGGILTNTNQHAAFLRMLSRGATTEIDGALSNPAGLAFLPKDGLSGKSRALLPPSPLRTVRESFPSYGSSNSIFLFVVRNRLILSTFSFISLVAVVVDKLPYNRTTNRYFVDVPCFCTVYFLAT